MQRLIQVIYYKNHKLLSVNYSKQLALNTWIKPKAEQGSYPTGSCYNYKHMYNNYTKDNLNVIDEKDLI